MNVYVVVILHIILSAATHIFAKSVVKNVDPLTLTFLRGIISGIGFLILCFAKNIKIVFTKDTRKHIFLLGFIAVLNQFLYLYGMQYTPAANGALLYATTPIAVLIFSKFLSKEKFTFYKLCGVSLAFIGVLLVIFEKGISTSFEYAFGNFVLIGAVISWALFTILGKNIVHKLGALPTSAYINLAGLLLITPIGIVTTSSFSFSTLTHADWIGIIYLGIGTSVISYILWYYALRKISASKLAVFTNGQPIAASIMSIIFLDATITYQFILGGLITISGVILAQKD